MYTKTKLLSCFFFSFKLFIHFSFQVVSIKRIIKKKRASAKIPVYVFVFVKEIEATE